MDWKVGIICACDRELEPFIPHISNRIISERAMLRLIEGNIGGVQVVAVYSGVCKVNAAIASQILIDIYGVNAIINAGAAGGMDTRLDIFDTVVCTNTAYHDVDDEILTEYHPFMQSSFFSSDDLLLTISKEMIQKAAIECTGAEWSRANSLLIMKSERKSTQRMRLFPWIWSRQVSPMCAM